jgi:predicted nucleic acid-binding protein
MNIILDSGYLIELFAKGGKHHKTADQMWLIVRDSKLKLHTLWECLAEASHKLNNEGRRAMLAWLARERVHIHHSLMSDLLAMADYMAKYDTASKGDGADITDVALVFLAERLKTAHIFTVDENDFSAYRTRTGQPFKIVWLTEAHRRLARD